MKRIDSFYIKLEGVIFTPLGKEGTKMKSSQLVSHCSFYRNRQESFTNKLDKIVIVCNSKPVLMFKT